MSAQNTTAPRSILVIGRRWFDRTYGNTYHSAKVYVDGVLTHSVPFAYGYESQYEQTAADLLGMEYPLRLSCEKAGITYATEVTDVSRKRDL